MDTQKIIMRWLQKIGSELKTGEQMLFPADSRQDQKDKKKLFLKELKALAKIDPVTASQLQVIVKFDDHRFWVVIKRIAFSPFIAFKKDRNEHVERVIMEDDSDKLRRLGLMREDGYTIEDIEKTEGPLSKEEKDFLKRERR